MTRRPPAARELEQRRVVGVGERLRLDHEHGGGRVEGRVDERPAVARHGVPVVREERGRAPARPVGCVPYDEPATPLGSLPPTAWSTPLASRLSAMSAPISTTTAIADPASRRVRLAVVGAGVLTRFSRSAAWSAPATTRGHSRRAVSRSGGAGVAPAVRDGLERARQLVERLRAEHAAHLVGRDRRPVPDRAAVAEAQQPGAEAQAERVVEPTGRARRRRPPARARRDLRTRSPAIRARAPARVGAPAARADLARR